MLHQRDLGSCQGLGQQGGHLGSLMMQWMLWELAEQTVWVFSKQHHQKLQHSLAGSPSLHPLQQLRVERMCLLLRVPVAAAAAVDPLHVLQLPVNGWQVLWLCCEAVL